MEVSPVLFYILLVGFVTVLGALIVVTQSLAKLFRDGREASSPDSPGGVAWTDKEWDLMRANWNAVTKAFTKLAEALIDLWNKYLTGTSQTKST